MPSTLIDIVEREAARHANKLAFEYLADDTDRKALSYSQLWCETQGVAARLRAAGVRTGDRVILIYPSGLGFPVAFLGTLLAGAIAVPIYPPRLRKDGSAGLRRTATDCGASVALISPGFAEKLEPLAPELGLRLIVDGEWTGPRHVRAKLPELAYLQYTSGSTDFPKGVMVTQANLLENLRYICARFRATSATVGVHWLPPYHDMGLVGGLLGTLYCGASSILMAPTHFIQKPFRWLEAISNYRGTISGGPNFAFDLCVARINEEQRNSLDLSSWELAFNGAEKVRGETLRKFAVAFAASRFRAESFFPCYGLAEATLMVSGCHAAPAGLEEDALVGCGAIREASGDVRIISPDGSVLQVGEGEIVVSGSSVAAGYWGRPQETATTFGSLVIDGKPFMRTGDIGFVRAGELVVSGRLKEMLIVRGRNYYPHDIESVVEVSHPSLAPNACVAFAVDTGSEQLVIVQEVRRDQVRNLDAASILEAMRHAVVRAFELRPGTVMLVRPATLPRTQNGKLRRIACRGAFVRGALEALATWHAEDSENDVKSEPPEEIAPAADMRNAIQAWLTSRIAAEAGVAIQEIDPASPLDDLMLDSLQQATLISELSERFGAVSSLLFLDYPTLESLSSYLAVVHSIRTSIARLPATHQRPTLLALADKPMTCPLASPGEIADAAFRVEAFPEVREFVARQQSLLSSNLPNPFCAVTSRIEGPRATIDGREVLNFSSNDYLGLATHPAVIAAAQVALRTFGSSVSASRLVAGERPVHRQLEDALAGLVGAEAALVFVGGNIANVSTIGHLFGPGDLVLYDERSHDSALKGIALGHAEGCPFRHNDDADADRILAAKRPLYRRVLVFIEGIYSMDGDIPNLPRFIEVKKRHRAILMVDECLSIGVLGATGRGIGEHFGVRSSDVDIWMGGISKALASCGGYIAGSRALIDYLRYTAPGFVFTTGIPAATAAAGLAAIETLQREPWRLQRLHENARLFLVRAKELGLDTGTSGGTPAVPVFIQDQAQCLSVYAQMRAQGINVQPIFPPAVPANKTRLRFFVTSMHTPDDIDRTVSILASQIQHTMRACA